MCKARQIAARRWLSHAALWVALAIAAPFGLWAYAAAGLELDLALLLSLCSTVAR